MSPEDDKQFIRISNQVDAIAAQLSEHWDTVQIFVTKHSGGERATFGYRASAGSFYTRYGQIKEWIAVQDERIRQAVKADEDDEE